MEKLAGVPSQQAGAAIIVFLTSAIGSWLNWGFGLVIGAIVAREIAKRLRDVDFAFLVAAAYMGFMTWASGLSSSIALVSATHGSALNIIEKQTGKIAGFDTTIFTYYNLVPVVLLVIAIPIALAFMGPSDGERKTVDPDVLIREDAADTQEAETEATFATALENSWIVTLLLVAMGVAYEVHLSLTKGFSLDLNNFIFLALMLGLIFHWRPIRYVRAFNSGARTVGPILLQFPLYGGIMGIMTGTGLAAVMAQSFVAFSTHKTLPFWSFISSNIISLFVPSGGGHWAVQGPFMVPAAVEARRRSGDDGDGHGDGRADGEYDPALLGLADPRHRPARHQGHHGLLRDRARHRARDLWRIAAGVRVRGRCYPSPLGEGGGAAAG